MTRRAAATKRARRKPAYRFTKEDCQRGYRAALARCMEDWDLLAWFTYRVRGWYRKKRASESEGGETHVRNASA